MHTESEVVSLRAFLLGTFRESYSTRTAFLTPYIGECSEGNKPLRKGFEHTST